MTTTSTTAAHVPEWLFHQPGDDGIVLGTLGRLVRNLPNHPFPGWSTAESRKAVAEELLPGLREIRGFKTAQAIEISALDYTQRCHLLCCKQLTPCMAARQDGCHVLLPPKKDTYFMVNEEEHLVAHIGRHGFAVKKVIQDMENIAEKLAEKWNFAYDSRYGYLTSIPTEAGDGMQLYCILHLPALSITGMMGQICKAMEKLHLTFTPYYSDGQDDTGHKYILCSLPGPEDSIWEIAEHFGGVANHLIRREKQVRIRLHQTPGELLRDNIGRAYGMLRHARRLSIQEMRNAFSLIQLATHTGHLEWQEGSDAMLLRISKTELEQALQAGANAEADDAGMRQLAIRRASQIRQFFHQHPHRLFPEDN